MKKETENQTIFYKTLSTHIIHDRPEKEIGMEQILKRYLSRILLALFLFGVPYAVMELIAQEGSFCWMMVIRGFFLTLSGNTWESMWYL